MANQTIHYAELKDWINAGSPKRFSLQTVSGYTVLSNHYNRYGWYDSTTGTWYAMPYGDATSFPFVIEPMQYPAARWAAVPVSSYQRIHFIYRWSNSYTGERPGIILRSSGTWGTSDFNGYVLQYFNGHWYSEVWTKGVLEPDPPIAIANAHSAYDGDPWCNLEAEASGTTWRMRFWREGRTPGGWFARTVTQFPQGIPMVGGRSYVLGTSGDKPMVYRNIAIEFAPYVAPLTPPEISSPAAGAVVACGTHTVVWSAATDPSCV